MIIWLTGLSGAGKTTIGKLLFEKIKEHNNDTVFLDGDILRDVWGDQLGHDVEGRRKNAQRISHLCAMLDKQGLNAIACVLSIFPDWRRWNRNNFSSYYEVFLDTPFEEVAARDSKGLYKAAMDGEIKNVVGVDIPMPKEETWDLRIETPEILKPPQNIADRIYETVKENFKS